MAELEHERQMVKNLNMELEAVIDSTNHIHEELKAELVQKSNDLAAMESQLNARESQISELTSLLNQATSENKAAGSGESGPADVEKSNELQIQVANLEKEVKKLELERDALQEDRRQELELLLVEKNSLEESLVELDSSHQEAMSQIVKSRAEVIQANEALKREIVQLEKRFTDEEKLMVGKIEEREKELSKYVEGDAALRTRTGELEAENVRVKEELKRNVDSVNELRSQTVQLKEKAASQDAEITRLASESERLRLENKELLRMAKPVETGSRAGESDFLRSNEDQTEQLRRELESSRLDVVSLTKDLNDAKNSLATSERQVKQLTDDLEMQRSRNSPNLDGRTLESNQLQLRFNDLEQRFNEQKVLLQCTESANKEHVQIQKQLEDEINRLTRQAEDFNTSSGDMESVVKLYEAEVERLLAVEEEHLNLSSRYKDLETEMEKLRKMATMEMKEEVSEKNTGIELSKHNDIVEDYKNIVNTLENRIQSLESEVALLRETNEMKRFVEGSEMLDGEANGSEIIHSNVNSVGDCKNFEVGKQNSDVWKSSSDEDIGRLKKTVSQQEDLIKTLNSKYSSMLRLLEDRSLSAHGSTVLADFHRLESEVHVLRTEKEHMMLILSEKTREASSLKGEVHHLMSVVSAGKSALAKLQQDTQDMVRNHETSNVDMKKEAIKKLSQLVQDRDIEIEALKEKNSTLLQVLQSSSPDAATRELSSLIEERDNLQRQVAAYQNDREQIISTLQVKHQESVSYYAEIERLSSFVSELTEQKERLERNLSNLTSQYEDKQKSLVKALNDFSNYKQKFFEVERRYNELQERLKCENGNSDVDAGKQTGGSLSYHQPMALDVETMKQDYEKLLTEQNSQILDLGKHLAELEQLLREKERHVSSKEQELSALSVKLHLSEASISAKDSELNSARKQCENLAFQLQGVTNERAELTGELDELRRRCESLSSDVQLTRQTNNAMTVSLSNKDLEINTLQEKVLSLDSIVQQRSEDSASGDNAQLEHLVKEVETLRSHGLLLQQDRDHLYLAILQFQAENTELKTELQRLREKEQRLAKECDRLRGHLLVIEEGHTREAIESEEREKDLRNRLATVEEKALSSSAAVVNARSDASRQLDNLQIQLHTIAEQRDNALLQLANAQETISSYANSLTNLQMVLEQFQAERHSHQVAEVEHYKKAVDAERAENKRLQSQLDQIEKQLEETVEALGAAERLSEQIDRKESMIAALREEVVLRENELSKVEMELKNVTSSVEAKVDKVIVKNLLRGYFHAPTSKRTEALQVIGQILSFTKEEMKEITGDSYGTSSWIGGFFRKTPPPLTKSSQSHTKSLNESFSQLFVKFLEQESAPHQQMRLPAELMVKEQQERRQQQQQRPLAFNPFSATVDPAMPLTLPALSDKTYQSPLLSGASAGGSSSQLLLGPASSQRLPIFAPAATRADTPVQGMTSSSQGRDAGVTSSGHSTPSGSGSILRDILQQR